MSSDEPNSKRIALGLSLQQEKPLYVLLQSLSPEIRLLALDYHLWYPVNRECHEDVSLYFVVSASTGRVVEFGTVNPWYSDYPRNSYRSFSHHAKDFYGFFSSDPMRQIHLILGRKSLFLSFYFSGNLQEIPRPLALYRFIPFRFLRDARIVINTPAFIRGDSEVCESEYSVTLISGESSGRLVLDGCFSYDVPESLPHVSGSIRELITNGGFGEMDARTMKPTNGLVGTRLHIRSFAPFRRPGIWRALRENGVLASLTSLEVWGDVPITGEWEAGVDCPPARSMLPLKSWNEDSGSWDIFAPVLTEEISSLVQAEFSSGGPFAHMNELRFRGCSAILSIMKAPLHVAFPNLEHLDISIEEFSTQTFEMHTHEAILEEVSKCEKLQSFGIVDGPPKEERGKDLASLLRNCRRMLQYYPVWKGDLIGRYFRETLHLRTLRKLVIPVCVAQYLPVCFVEDKPQQAKLAPFPLLETLRNLTIVGTTMNPKAMSAEWLSHLLAAAPRLTSLCFRGIRGGLDAILSEEQMAKMRSISRMLDEKGEVSSRYPKAKCVGFMLDVDCLKAILESAPKCLSRLDLSEMDDQIIPPRFIVELASSLPEIKYLALPLPPTYESPYSEYGFFYPESKLTNTTEYLEHFFQAIASMPNLADLTIACDRPPDNVPDLLLAKSTSLRTLTFYRLGRAAADCLLRRVPGLRLVEYTSRKTISERGRNAHRVKIVHGPMVFVDESPPKPINRDVEMKLRLGPVVRSIGDDSGKISSDLRACIESYHLQPPYVLSIDWAKYRKDREELLSSAQDQKDAYSRDLLGAARLKYRESLAKHLDQIPELSAETKSALIDHCCFLTEFKENYYGFSAHGVCFSLWGCGDGLRFECDYHRRLRHAYVESYEESRVHRLFDPGDKWLESGNRRDIDYRTPPMHNPFHETKGSELPKLFCYDQDPDSSRYQYVLQPISLVQLLAQRILGPDHPKLSDTSAVRFVVALLPIPTGLSYGDAEKVRAFGFVSAWYEQRKKLAAGEVVEEPSWRVPLRCETEDPKTWSWEEGAEAIRKEPPPPTPPPEGDSDDSDGDDDDEKRGGDGRAGRNAEDVCSLM